MSDHFISITDATKYLGDAVRTDAARSGWNVIIEFASGSESTYFHIQRPIDGHATWFGVRVSAHAAVYPCSRDYESIVLPTRMEDELLHRTETVLKDALRNGLQVVADPHEVRRAIWLHEILAADGVQVLDSSGRTWTWSAEQARWCGHDGPPPMQIPHVTASTRDSAAIRHRLNSRAKWIADVRLGKW